MIFVTVGTERFPFDRLIRAVDSLMNIPLEESIFMQIGFSTYIPSSPHERFLSATEFRERISKAKIVVSHAGAGTLLMCANFGKVPIMMPRKKSFGEHVDDHQQMLAERMAKRGRILLINSPEELEQNILNYEEQCKALPPDPDQDSSPLTQHLKNLLDGIIKLGDDRQYP